MAGTSNSGKKRFDPSKIVTSGPEPNKAETNVKADAASAEKVKNYPPAGCMPRTGIPAEAVTQPKSDSPSEAVAPREAASTVKYIVAAVLVVCIFFLFKTFSSSSLFSATSDPNKTIEKYYSSVQKNDVETALQQFASSKRPKINRKWLEAVARDTDYYRIEQFKTLQMDEEKAKVLVLFYHKKRGSAEEYWDTTLTLVKESGEWRIWTMTGNKLK